MRPPVPSPGSDVNKQRLEDIDYRRQLIHRHQLWENKYLLETVVIDEAYHLIVENVLVGTGGLVFIAEQQRVGRTRCTWSVYHKLSAAFPNIPFDLVVARDGLHAKPDLFYRDFLDALGGQIQGRPRTVDWFAILKHYFTMQCIKNQSTAAFLIVDEAQTLTLRQFQHLFHLLNRLELDGFALHTILFAQSEFRRILEMANEYGYEEVMGRFFVKRARLRGVRTKAEVLRMLEQFDTTLCYPADATDWPFTRFFAREAFDAGMRLADEIDTCWAAILEVEGFEGEVPESADGIRMTWLVRGIRYYLTDLLASAEPAASEAAAGRWLDAMRRGFRDAPAEREGAAYVA